VILKERRHSKVMSFKKYRLSHEEFIERVKKAQGERITILEQYQRMNTKIKALCNTCGYADMRHPQHLVNGFGCANCVGKLKLTTETFKQRMLSEPSGDEYTLLCEYKNNEESVLMRHTCGFEFNVKPNHFISSGSRCPRCQMETSGERAVREVLEELDVSFEWQYSFPDCKNKKELRFDFAVFDNVGEISFMIEFDGNQHYNAVMHFGGPEALKYIQTNDEIKNNYCKEKNLKLIRLKEQDLKDIKNIIIKNLELA
jgi:predicted Zn-ribbon and HTH transcriptional regulator